MIFVQVSGILTFLYCQLTQPGFPAVLVKFLLYAFYHKSPFETAYSGGPVPNMLPFGHKMFFT